ncbi:hypothetical protein HN604_03635 [archaeon]|nr:hypothetical protein [archaeon]MBT7661145.1 hypothetical protein [archaeon]
MVMKSFTNRRGMIEGMIIMIVIIGILFVIFLTFSSQKMNSNGVKQQVLEKELALLIDSARPGMEFVVEKQNPRGVIRDVRVNGGKIFVDVDNLNSLVGYPYFSLHSVKIIDEEKIFKVVVE